MNNSKSKKMSLENKVQEKLIKELELFNENFTKYKEKYLDQDDPSGEDDIAKELLYEIMDVFKVGIRENKKECSICLDKINNKNDNCKLGCGHEFHLSCIFKLNKVGSRYGNICPLCRVEFNKNIPDTGTMDTIHDISARLPGLKSLLIHRVTHLSDQQLNTLSNLMDVLD